MPRNNPKYVLQTQGHHPGYTDYLVVSSEVGLIELSQAIERLSKLSNGARIDFRLGDRTKREGGGHIAFALCSEEKLEELATESSRSGAKSLILLLIPLVLLSAVGAWHTLKYAVDFLLL